MIMFNNYYIPARDRVQRCSSRKSRDLAALGSRSDGGDEGGDRGDSSCGGE